MTLPRYPVFVPSKNRASACQTARFLDRDSVPFRVVCEPQDVKAYADKWGRDRVLTLPHRDKGLHVTRNWILEFAKKEGHERHWQLDDNIQMLRRRHKGKRLPCQAGVALRACEDFTDRYENIDISGLNYAMFCCAPDMPPFYLNARVYSLSLISCVMPFRYRNKFNDDVDICLQILAAGRCTVLFNAFMGDKVRTMRFKGGNTELYTDTDGRLKMARSLERVWPYVVSTKRRFQRPQHVVRDSWRSFDNPLIRRKDIDWGALKSGGADNYGMKLRQKHEPRSIDDDLKAMIDE